MDGMKIVAEDLNFLDSVNFQPMCLKSMAKSSDLTCRNGYYPHFLIRPQIVTLLDLIPNPDSMVQTACQGMYEEQKDNIFCNGRCQCTEAGILCIYEIVF